GFRTCILANTWLDDGEGRLRRARLLGRLRREFPALLESCRLGMRQPEPGIYSHALQALQAQPHQV
ncbi:HYES hydrolase, partial [Tyrannus savana]|nr:HYES hydrolase [Tyrannus savana]